MRGATLTIEQGESLSLSSACHGAGRMQSRTKARAATRDRNIPKELAASGSRN